MSEPVLVAEELRNARTAIDRISGRAGVEDLLDAGDATVALIHTTATGRISGIEIDERVAHVFWLRDATPYHFKVFTERVKALEAAGLRE